MILAGSSSRKWDGFRCLAYRAGTEIELRAKSGKPLARYFPEVTAMLKGLPQKEFVVDGELAVPVGDTLSFDALQLRVHPAESRVKKLAAETPALLVLFDMLVDSKGRSLIEKPLSKRRAALEDFYKSVRETERLKLSPYTLDLNEARRWLDDTSGALDGVVAKHIDGAYLPGQRAMLKVKRLRTADCVVGGFRYGSGSREVGSLLLGLYDRNGLLDHVGFTSTISNKERHALTRTLEALIAPPGFTCHGTKLLRFVPTRRRDNAPSSKYDRQRFLCSWFRALRGLSPRRLSSSSGFFLPAHSGAHESPRSSTLDGEPGSSALRALVAAGVHSIPFKGCSPERDRRAPSRGAR